MAPRKITRADGTVEWEDRVRVGGRRPRIHGRTKAEVTERAYALRDRERKRKLGLPQPQGPISYGQLVEKVLAQYAHRPQSKRHLRYTLKYSRDRFETTYVRELLPETIGIWLASLDVGEQTRASALKAMRQVLNKGVTWHYIEHNAARDVPMPKRYDDPAVPFESWHEVYAVADSIAAHYEPDGALVVFACATGLRPQEWLALQWRDVDRGRGVLHVRRTLQNGRIAELTGKTRGALRQVELQRRATEALDRLPTPLDTTQLVFPNRGGGVLNLHNWRQRAWRPALERTALAYRAPYQMRHTFATLALAAECPLEWVSSQMGHNDIQTTRTYYARFLPQVDRRNVAFLDAFEPDAATEWTKTAQESAGGSLE